MHDRAALILLLGLTGCGREPPPTAPFDWTDETTPEVPSGPVVLQPKTWTAGPDLPACTPSAGDPDRVALSGVVLLPGGPVPGQVVVDRVTGLIECAGASCDPGGATVVCTDGVISPALIDTHDHAQYNVIGPWRHGKRFNDRYEWQSDFDYFEFRTAYDEMSSAFECEIVKWAELRHIVGGATSVVGSTGDPDCIGILARNLDEAEDAHGLSDYDLSYSSSRVGTYSSASGISRAEDIATGSTVAFLDHVAEGFGGSVRSEIDHMFNVGMSGPGTVFVHATDASLQQIARMAATSTGIVWSPRSNLDLYGETTPADLAVYLGVPLAIGPDWTWSGSNRVTDELACAYDWLNGRGSAVDDADLWAMVTGDAAELLGLQDRLGALVPGAEADISVFTWSAEPYRAIIEAGHEDVRLVLIDGHARYGVPALVDGLQLNADWCETVTACAESRTICAAEGDTGTDAQTYSQLEATLAAALAATPMPEGLAYAGELYPLWACEEDRGTCAPGNPIPGDVDGDGISDAIDSCPAAYDPSDVDSDNDGIGDVCDPCPLSPDVDCVFDPNDIDGDGIPNGEDGCPWIWDPGNPDRDGDGRPDACDPCPDIPNPGNLGCPATIRALRDPTDPAHVAEGTLVTIQGVVVTATSSTGAFLQDPAQNEFGALFAVGVDENPGTLVDVTGEYAENLGLTEIRFAVATVVGTAPIPPPITVGVCNIGTGGSDAERYESMLVRVADVEVSDANPDAPSDFNEFEVGGCLRVDDQLCPTCWADQPAVGTRYAFLTGPLTYNFSNTKLLPRTSSDLVLD